MKEKEARKFMTCIETLQNIAYGSPSIGSLRVTEMFGNEFKTEYIKLIEKARKALKDIGLEN